MDKHYIVWYKALGGGLIISWLFQLCVNHKSLNEALNVFPVDLKDNNSNCIYFIYVLIYFQTASIN